MHIQIFIRSAPLFPTFPTTSLHKGNPNIQDRQSTDPDLSHDYYETRTMFLSEFR